ncbi:MAG TPA: flagellar motor protein MotB [Bacteroidia bacterium]|jgi:chemotaxis protein MotB|nr:flagellar motor protein MotB [Bacteroidia bacterium]
MKKYFIILLGFAFILNACVPKRKLIHEQIWVRKLQADSASTHNKLSSCNNHLDSLGNYASVLRTHIDSLRSYRANLQDSINTLWANYQLALRNSNKTISEQAKQLNNMQRLIQSQKDIMNRLKKTVADALINFKPDELSVVLKDGKLYVSLQEKLLFKSGSAEVDPKGKTALKNLASVLNKTSGISIMVEGHTDTVPITGKYEDNWALSTARATAIVRILTNDYEVDPHTIIASGRSKYYPVSDNSTSEGRARNRRTEIILSPDLTELFKLLND